MALLVGLALAGPARAVEWCTPDTAKEAYDALIAAAPDGGELETQARKLAEERRAEGEFDTDETIEELDDLAYDWDYLFDCDGRVYRYAPDETEADDDAGDDEAGKAPPATSPTTARPAPRPPPAPTPTTRPAPAPATAPAAASSRTPQPAPAPSYAAPPASTRRVTPSTWVTAWATPTTSTAAATPITAPPAATPVQSPPPATAVVSSDTEDKSDRTDRRLLLVLAALGIAAGVDLVNRLARRRRRR